jgi:hypothetical protein
LQHALPLRVANELMHALALKRKREKTSGKRLLQVEPLATCQTSADRIVENKK